MKYKLFGKNIATDCSYCEHADLTGSMPVCTKGKAIRDGKCRSFSYDPLQRVPASVSLSGSFTAEDFKL